MRTLGQDLRYAARALAKNPGFTLVAVLTLGLGIGANTAIFSVIDVVMLKSLPVRDPERLVLFGRGESAGLTNHFPDGSTDLFSYPFYLEARRRNQVFSGVAAFLSLTWKVHGMVNTAGAGAEAEQMNVQLVSGTYFPVLGVRADRGRTLTEADDQTPGAHPLAVVSYAWWERRLGRDPSAIGKTITIDRTVYTIVGVAPKEFFGTTLGQSPDLWVPLAMEAQMPPAHWYSRYDQSQQSLYLIGRLKDGVSAERAGADVNLLFRQSLREQAGRQPPPERLREIERARIELTPARTGFSPLRREFSLSLRVLMAMVCVVLLIACANVANLLLARAVARQREFAVRAALGAGRLRLVRQLLTESVLLALLGGFAGVMLAWWGSSLLLLTTSAGAQPLPLDVTPDARVFGFTLLACALSAIVFGTAPALRASRTEPNAALTGGRGSGQTTSQSRFGKLLVVAQIALSLLLLVVAGLFVRTLANLRSVPTGFDQQNVLVFRTDVAATGFKGVQLTQLLREIERKVKALPGVQAAAFSFMTFNQGQWTSVAYTRDEPSDGHGREFRNNIVGLDYFMAVGIPLVKGRLFSAHDTERPQRVAVINETMAQRLFPNRSPLGQRFGRLPEDRERFEIVGVVKDARYGSLTEPPQATAYYSYEQQDEILNNLLVRYAGSPDSVVRQVRQAFREVNRNLPVDEVVTLSEQIDRSLGQPKLIARLAAFFGLLALVLASVGLYGLLSYTAGRRANEIGIRRALGARRGDVLWLVLRDALALVGVGVAVGLAVSLTASRAATALLFGLRPNDPLTITCATLLILAVAAVAGYQPARRSTKIDPLVALRYE